MRFRAELALTILASIALIAARPSRADEQPPQAIVPAGWAGIWQVDEESRDCTTNQLINTYSYLDTLCANRAYYLMPGLYLTRSAAGYVYATCNGGGFTET